MRYQKQLLIFLMLFILFPFNFAQGLQSQHELAFQTDITFETQLINLVLVKFKLQAEINISPQFALALSQNLRDAGETDMIRVSLFPEGFTGHLTLKAVDENDKVLTSHSLPFHVENSPLGDVVIPLPEVGLTLIIGVVTISPNLIISSSVNSRVEVQGPATISSDSVKWVTEGQKTIDVNFQTNKKHVIISLTDINYALDAYLQVGVKAIGFELLTLETSPLTRTLTGTPSRLSAGDYNALPTAGFSFTPVKPTAADTVRFTDSSSDDDGNIMSWSWEFGDGSISMDRNPSHQFKVGSYNVILTVNDDKGATDSKIITVMISKVPTTLTCEVSTDKIIKGEKITISGSIKPQIKEIITLTLTKPDGTHVDDDIISNIDGSYSYEFTPDIVGSWSVKASSEGDSEYEDASSQQISFSVEEKKAIVSPGQEPSGQKGIPGFPYLAVILGLMVGILVIWMFQRKQ